MMKIGILLCDEVDDVIRARVGSYFIMFSNFFNATGGDYEFKGYDVTRCIYPSNWNECDGYVITGSKYSCYEKLDWILKLTDKIRECHANKIKLFGVCFGHQIIAHSLGGKTEKYSDGWGLSVQQFNVVSHFPWMKDKMETVSIGLSCQDQVVAVPPDAEVYLSGAFVKNAGYVMNNTILTVQGHPEMMPAFLTYLIQKRVKTQMISEQQANSFYQQMKTPAHNVLMAKWATDFFRM